MSSPTGEESLEDYDPVDNAVKSYDVAINALREKLASFRCEEIGACRLYLGDCREVLPLLGRVARGLASLAEGAAQ